MTGLQLQKALRAPFLERTSDLGLIGGSFLLFNHEGGSDFSQCIAYGCVRALRGCAEEKIGSFAGPVFPCVDF